ncbi:GTP-binding protein, partial [Klebsiella pneumoniae]|uniref:GTP-binding protein n=1 Tax=Klebsiella pneumoniae TaxID=573 RepID=UPI003F1E9008
AARGSLEGVDAGLLVIEAGRWDEEDSLAFNVLRDAGIPVVLVVNKIDRPGARPEWVIDQVFDLFDKLGATNEQLDFPIVYASALNGYAGLEDTVRDGDMTPLYEAIMQHA